jgi:hypothetical protein
MSGAHGNTQPRQNARFAPGAKRRCRPTKFEIVLQAGSTATPCSSGSFQMRCRTSSLPVLRPAHYPTGVMAPSQSHPRMRTEDVRGEPSQARARRCSDCSPDAVPRVATSLQLVDLARHAGESEGRERGGNSSCPAFSRAARSDQGRIPAAASACFHNTGLAKTCNIHKYNFSTEHKSVMTVR